MSSKLFKILIVVGILIALYFINKAAAHASQEKPQYGDYVCWYSSTKDTCGTYGWHKDKKVAEKAALDLCLKACDESCALDYCERL